MISMDQAIRVLAKVLTVLGLVGAVGCALVIPKTAYNLFSTFFSDDAEEEDHREHSAVVSKTGADETVLTED